jgi:hypothetical protein
VGGKTNKGNNYKDSRKVTKEGEESYQGTIAKDAALSLDFT